MPNKTNLIAGSLRQRLILAFLASSVVLPVLGFQILDDFSSGTQTWVPGPGWSVTNFVPGVYFYRCNYAGDSLTWKKYAPLGAAWKFQADLKFRTLYGNSGTTGVGSLALSQDGSNPSIRFLASITHHSSGSVLIEAQYFDGSWHEILSSGWLSGTSPEYQFQLERVAGSNSLELMLQSTNGFSYTVRTSPVPPDLFAGLSIPGFRVNSALVDCANVQLASSTSPSPQKDYGLMATNAINDLLSHFWVGDAQTGQIINTWYGYTNAPLPDPRGALWERAMLYLTLENFSRLRTNATIQQRLQADWNRTAKVYTTNQLEDCGEDSGTNWAVDDAGWAHELQSTTNLSGWKAVTNFFSDPGSKLFKYTPLGSNQNEFYRAVLSLRQ